MQGLPKSIIVAAMAALMTPALALAAADGRAAARKAQGRQQAAGAAKISLIRQMQGNSDPALRAQLIRQQMQGGK